MKQWRHYSLRYYSLLVLVYAIVSLFIPLNHDTRATYELSMVQAHAVSLIAAIPLFVIWFAAFYCYGRLQRYADTVRDSREGKAFRNIADGVTLLSWGLVIESFASLLLGALADHTSAMVAAAAIIQNYVTLVFPVVAFLLIGTGTQRLLALKRARLGHVGMRLLILLSASIAAIYSYLILHLMDHGQIYHLPVILLLVTVVIPYLFAWFSGLLAAFEMLVHARGTHGLLYKRGLDRLAGGLIVLIITSIVMQYINSALLSNLGAVSIGTVLVVDYLLLMGIAIGYILMISGIRRLQRIEEI